MSKQIQTQADKLLKIVTDQSTAATYQQALAVTWTILKETGYLLWLVVCLGLVFGDWVWKTGYRTGWNFRGWLNSFEQPSADQVLSETGKSILEVGKSTAANAIAAAKEQLGIENKPEPPLVASPPRPPKPAPAPEKVPVATPEPPVVSTEEE
ncbi:hypothetical protein K9N68_32280 [Kovacikia minuta CCNUW1]|uniref:hypothetical protein n=1 Tax=Kovacikia minuta TaxID=2931930 RepID=UPI001CD036FF|nr:hypothetical protein [Kovacikia minuta]UBF26151.1 hypothetical protein K9N68_32280 [Kovacikia minuta CCNUW1]